MRAKKFMGAMVAASVAFMPIASSAASYAGVISATKGDAFVSRGGQLVRATPNMKLVAGDRVITRANGSATVSGACAATLGASQMSTVGSDCGKVASFDRAGYAGRASAQDDGGSSEGTIVLILAAIAVGLGIYVAVDNNDSAPTSP